MSRSVKKVLREEYNRLKRAVEKMMSPKKEDASQLVLQPVRNPSQNPTNKKYLRGTHLP